MKQISCLSFFLVIKIFLGIIYRYLDLDFLSYNQLFAINNLLNIGVGVIIVWYVFEKLLNSKEK